MFYLTGAVAVGRETATANPALLCVYLFIPGKSLPSTKLNRKPEGKGRLVWFIEVNLPGTQQEEVREWVRNCS